MTGIRAKRARVAFLTNARLQTLTDAFVASLRPSGFLVPPLYASRSVRAALTALPAKHRREILVDNGLFDDLTRIRSQFASRAAKIGAGMRLQGIDTAASPPRSSVPPAFRSQVDELAEDLQAAAKTAKGMSLSAQLELGATSVIGAERITGALWYSMGLEPSVLGNGRRRISRLNAEVIAATKLTERVTALEGVEDLPVVSAVDYATARDAGRALAAADIRRFSVPFGAFMADDRSTSSYVGSGGRVKLASSVPARVIRSALVARGLMDGWNETRRTPPEHLHLLGLGQPLIMGLVAAALDRAEYLTADATSPFKDAAAGQIYTSVPVFRRLRGSGIVWTGLTTPSTEWNCPCVWCKAAAPYQDWAAARAWLSRNGRSVQGPDDLPLKGSARLAKLLPYFRMDAPADLLKSRIGHNHWSLQESAHAIARAARVGGGAARLMKRWIKAYPVTDRANPFHRALVAGLDIVSR